VAARIRAGASGIALLALGIPLSACGAPQDVAVSNVVEDFYRAVAKKDGATACALLVPATRDELEQSSGKKCAVALLEEASDIRGDHGDIQVFDTMAQVQWADRTTFLARMPDGWRVLALACTPRPVGPYDCKVKGG
jgi:hypothetical protein